MAPPARNATIELGLDTFGDVTVDADGEPLSQAQVLRNVVEEAVLADRLGLAFFGVGEHHRKDFAVSAPEVVLAAIAGRTERIHLGTAVTVLSTDDPVRVYQRFSTLNALSNGRAEIILGRGSFTESFPLFGHDLSQYELLFDEKLDLFASLLDQEAVTWSGRTRASLNDQRKLQNETMTGHATWKIWKNEFILDYGGLTKADGSSTITRLYGKATADRLVGFGFVPLLTAIALTWFVIQLPTDPNMIALRKSTLWPRPSMRNSSKASTCKRAASLRVGAQVISLAIIGS